MTGAAGFPVWFRASAHARSTNGFVRLKQGGAEVLDPGIAHERDDGRVGSQLFGQSQGRGDVGAGGGPGKEAFFARQSSGHGRGLYGRNLVHLVGDVVVPERHDETRADPVDLVGTGRATRQDRGLGRLHGDDANLLVVAA